MVYTYLERNIFADYNKKKSQKCMPERQNKKKHCNMSRKGD